jgi:hypothetical protein
MYIVPNEAPEIIPYSYNVPCSTLPDGTYITFESTLITYDNLIQTLKFIKIVKNAQETVYVSTATAEDLATLNIK